MSQGGGGTLTVLLPSECPGRGCESQGGGGGCHQSVLVKGRVARVSRWLKTAAGAFARTSETYSQASVPLMASCYII